MVCCHEMNVVVILPQVGVQRRLVTWDGRGACAVRFVLRRAAHAQDVHPPRGAHCARGTRGHSDHAARAQAGEARKRTLQGGRVYAVRAIERVPAGSCHFSCLTDPSQSVVNFPCIWKENV